MGAAKLQDTPTAQAADNNSLLWASFCRDINIIVARAMIKSTCKSYSINSIDGSDEFAHEVSYDAREVDKGTLDKQQTNKQTTNQLKKLLPSM